MNKRKHNVLFGNGNTLLQSSICLIGRLLLACRTYFIYHYAVPTFSTHSWQELTSGPSSSLFRLSDMLTPGPS